MQENTLITSRETETLALSWCVVAISTTPPPFNQHYVIVHANPIDYRVRGMQPHAYVEFPAKG